MTERERKTIKVRGDVVIEDSTVYSPDKSVYLMTADVFDKIGEKVEEGQLIFMDGVSFEGEVAKLVARSKKHVENILDIQARNGGRLDNIKLFNLTIEEAEERGFLSKPDVI
jgi:hypothetical protein